MADAKSFAAHHAGMEKLFVTSERVIQKYISYVINEDEKDVFTAFPETEKCIVGPSLYLSFDIVDEKYKFVDRDDITKTEKDTAKKVLTFMVNGIQHLYKGIAKTLSEEFPERSKLINSVLVVDGDTLTFTINTFPEKKSKKIGIIWS
jgi:hypothetical protein